MYKEADWIIKNKVIKSTPLPPRDCCDFESSDPKNFTTINSHCFKTHSCNWESQDYVFTGSSNHHYCIGYTEETREKYRSDVIQKYLKERGVPKKKDLNFFKKLFKWLFTWKGFDIEGI